MWCPVLSPTCRQQGHPGVFKVGWSVRGRLKLCDFGEMTGTGDDHVKSASFTRTRISCFSLFHEGGHESKWVASKDIGEEREEWRKDKERYKNDQNIWCTL